jgi:wyosine [tRNA(Phe)-imidazoG37] synthetase (radical SAM superfamily)
MSGRNPSGNGLVYPVFSRRSGGLSIGIDLFPEGKTCSFDCPYCELFPSPAVEAFSLDALREELDEYLDQSYPSSLAGTPIRDLCLSGNGEPTLSPHLESAIAILADARRSRPELLRETELLLITNSTGFLDPWISEILSTAVAEEGLRIWAKLDAGTEPAFQRMSRSAYGLEEIMEGLRDFAFRTAILVQSMFCRLGGEAPTEEEIQSYSLALAGLLRSGAKLDAIHVYTQARPAPEGITSPLGDAEIAALAARIRSGLENAVAPGTALPTILAFGSQGMLPASGTWP